ncbi:hypothetical protein [Streptomyces sp. IGB124]|uniref:hypothetical protein n=1 Tax=Streptomyces sp. IGB124 TaxID=1519485 RepID=UPI000A404840|nr:hypothetical protein [Streptomyces sp. IGB124]
MRILRKLFPSWPAVEPTAPPLPGPQADPDRGDDGMGESWVWVPGDLDDEEADR